MTLSRRWVWLFALGGLPLLGAGISRSLVDLVVAWYGILVTLALTDWLLFPDLAAITLTRELDSRITAGQPTPARLLIHNETGIPLTLQLRDTIPAGIPDNQPENGYLLSLYPDDEQFVEYTLTPRDRGDFTFGDIYIRVRGRLGLVWRPRRIPQIQLVGVYPAIGRTPRVPLAARPSRLYLSGLRSARIQGAGSEFESLREYLPNDELRRVDWKATARHGKLMSRQYEVERSQSIIIALDTGRMMRGRLNGVQKLDHAVEAALTLARVAADHDDHVGLLVFSDTVQTFLLPRKGRAQLAAIMEALHTAEATLAEPDYHQAFAYLRSRVRRRSLVVCFTDLWDPESGRIPIEALSDLHRRHVVAAVTLLDPTLLGMADQPVSTIDRLYEKAVAVQALQERREALHTLKKRGILVVDSPADKLSIQVVSRYVQVKERMLL